MRRWRGSPRWSRNGAMTRWPLSALLDLAATHEAAARRALASAVAMEDGRRRGRDAAEAVLGAHRAAEACAGGRRPDAAPSAASLHAAAFHVARLRTEGIRLAQALDGCQAALADSLSEVEARRDALAAARVAVRALETLRDGWRAARRRERDRAEEAATEELVSGRPRAAS